MLRFAACALPWAWFAVRDGWAILDLVAIGLPLLAIAGVGAALVAAAVLRKRWLLLPAASYAIFGLVAVLGPGLSAAATPPPDQPLVVATGNIGARPATADAQLASIDALGADLLVVTEVDLRFRDRVAARFPHHVATPAVDQIPPPPGSAQVVVGSVHRLRAATADGLPGLRVVVDAPAGPLVLYALHIPKPSLTPGRGTMSFPERRSLVLALRQRMAEERLPVVVAGDLNAPDRTRDYRILKTGRRDAVAPDDAGRTSFRRPVYWSALWLRIDHILVPDSWCTDHGARFELPGSDHRGVVAHVGRCPGRSR